VGRSTGPKPGSGEARVRYTAVGLNYMDIYVRRGLYPDRCQAVSVRREPVGSRMSALGSPTLKRAIVLRMPGGTVGRLFRGAGDAGRPAGRTTRGHL
jgi:hypothetical protein